MTYAPTLERKSAMPVFDTAPVAAPRGEAAAEETRWLLMLLVPFVVGAGFFAAAIGTGTVWLIGPAIGIGVMCLIFTFIYLMLSSDSN